MSNPSTETEPTSEAAQQLLTKVRTLIDGLSEDERKLFAMLIGPGVASLMAERLAAPQDHGATWEPNGLRADLAKAITTSPWRVVAA